MNEREAFEKASLEPCRLVMPVRKYFEAGWQAALDWARTQQEPIYIVGKGWQVDAMPPEGLRLYAHPAPAQPVRLSEDEVESIRLQKYAYAAPADHFHEMVKTIQDAMLAKGAAQPSVVQQLETIALIAHHGGLISLSESEALTMIRKLTINHHDWKMSVEEAKAALKAAKGE